LTQNIDAETGADFEIEGYTFKVSQKEGHQLHYLEVIKK